MASDPRLLPASSLRNWGPSLGVGILCFLSFFSRTSTFAGVAESLGIATCVAFIAASVPFLMRRWPAPSFGCAAVGGLVSILTLSPPTTHLKGQTPIVLITIDTFRADHVNENTPHLLSLASEGVRFTNAITTAPLTAPAHASLLTGLDVDVHGLRKNGGLTDSPTIVEHLRAKGWRTGAFVSANVLGRHTHLDRGFEHYDDRFSLRARWAGAFGLFRTGAKSRSGADTVERALSWLGSGESTFLWIHLYDAHLPYAPPAEFRPTPDQLSALKAADRNDESVHPEGRHGSEGKAMYAAETRWVDALVGRIVAGTSRETRVIAVADHGEALGEHEYWFNHGAMLHEPAVHIPMIVRWPGTLAAGSSNPQLTSITAVHDWIGAMAGLNAPPIAIQKVLAFTPGQQNRRSKNREAPKPQVIAGFRYADSKLVAAAGSGAQFFDLSLDPYELSPQPVPAGLTDDAAALALHLDAPLSASSEEKERLKALGYVE